MNLERLLLFPLFANWISLFAFLFSLAESIAPFGIFIPGQTIVIIAGFLAKQGVVSLGEVFIAAAVGSILGDVISYMLGKKYGYPFLKKYGKYIGFKEQYYESTKKHLKKHTALTLLLGRFYWLTRAFVPFIAGSTKISFIRVFISSLIAGTLWAGWYAIVGWLFGASFNYAKEYTGTIILVSIIAGFALIYLYKFINKHHALFKRYHLYTLILCLFSLLLFGKLAQTLNNPHPITNLDQTISAQMPLFWNPLGNILMKGVTLLANTYTIIALSLLLSLVLIKKKRYYPALLWITSVITTAFLVIFIKGHLTRPRPFPSLIPINGFSFPSGHAALSIVFFSFLIYAFKEDIQSHLKKELFLIGSVILFLLVGISRIYLNVHWVTDVVAGFALGLFVLTFLILTFRIAIHFYNLNRKRS